MTTNLTSQTAPVTEKELDQLIWGLERYGLYPRQLAALKELREVRKAKGEPVAYADPRALSNFEARSATREWMWARSDTGLIPLYIVPQVPEMPDEMAISDDMNLYQKSFAQGHNACRAAMLQAGNSPVTPDGYVLVPKKLTAENGAKSVLSGEFSETKFINCPECFGDDDCETCDGSGRIEITVPVTWTTIKAIWTKGVEHFAKVSPREVG